MHKGSFSTQRCEIVIMAHTQFHILTEVKKKKKHKDEQENSLTSFKEHQKIRFRLSKRKRMICGNVIF